MRKVAVSRRALRGGDSRRLRARASSANRKPKVGRSHVLMKPIDPTITPDSPRNAEDSPQVARDRDFSRRQNASPSPATSSTNGIDMTWGCRSPRMKLKNGNSVIVPASGEMRVARHHHQKLV